MNQMENENQIWLMIQLFNSFMVRNNYKTERNDLLGREFREFKHGALQL